MSFSFSLIKKTTSEQRNATLLFKSEKLLAAEKIFTYFTNMSLAEMKATLITPNLQIFDSEITVDASEPKRFQDLHTHFTSLQHEFLDQPLLCLYHAVLVVLLRRKFDTTNVFQAFEQLWQTEFVLLSQMLSLRWLVSAADTFIDFSPSPVRRAILMNVTSLINTLKAYETQQYVSLGHGIVDDKKIRSLREKHRQLYDGLTFLRLGSDDTIEQMRRRFLSFAQDDGFATQFLLKIFDRLHDNQTAYAFFKQMHTEDWGYRWSYPFKKGEK